MRAGKLDRQIEIETLGPVTPNEYGVSDPADAAFWINHSVRAEIVQSSTQEYLRGYGEGGNTGIIFRIRFMPGVSPDRAVVYEGRRFNIREVTEIGRRKGLELRCEEVRA